MSSPLNKLADALPSFILQVQDMKMRQEYYEAITSYRTGMLAQKIETNRIADLVQREQERLGRISAGQKERENILEAVGKYGEAGARAIFPEATPRQFPEGLPPEKPTEKKPTATEGFKIGKLEKRIDALLEKKRLAGQTKYSQFGDEIGKYPLFTKMSERLLKRHLESLSELGVEYPESIVGVPFQGPTITGDTLDVVGKSPIQTPETDSLRLFE